MHNARIPVSVMVFLLAGLGGCSDRSGGNIAVTNDSTLNTSYDTNMSMGNLGEPVTDTAEAPEVDRPASGMIEASTRDERVARLRITTPASENGYYFKLVDATSSATVMTMFADGGETITVRVPLGTYRLRYASGRTWRGSEALFGSETQYSEAGEPLSFEQIGNEVSGYAIELTRQEGGNLSEVPLSAGSF